MRLVEFDQTSLEEEEKFYANGFSFVKPFDLPNLKITPKSDMVNVLRDLWEGKIKDGFSWEQKGQNSFHLRPAVHEYHEIFIDFLFKLGIPAEISRLTGRKLHLYHAQVVKSIPGPSYQDWHRDSYQWGSNPIVGAFPAVLKVNFYPQFENSEPRLKFIRGSHRCQANDPRFDALLINKYENEIIHSSNEQVLMFDSALLHGVVPDVNPKGSIRLMYSFGMEHEYLKRFANKKHHKELHEFYEGLLEKSNNEGSDDWQ
jgi:hypothetical protein